jgi:hypothetical protein
MHSSVSQPTNEQVRSPRIPVRNYTALLTSTFCTVLSTQLELTVDIMIRQTSSFIELDACVDFVDFITFRKQ